MLQIACDAPAKQAQRRAILQPAPFELEPFDSVGADHFAQQTLAMIEQAIDETTVTAYRKCHCGTHQPIEYRKCIP